MAIDLTRKADTNMDLCNLISEVAQAITSEEVSLEVIEERINKLKVTEEVLHHALNVVVAVRFNHNT